MGEANYSFKASDWETIVGHFEDGEDGEARLPASLGLLILLRHGFNPEGNDCVSIYLCQQGVPWAEKPLFEVRTDSPASSFTIGGEGPLKIAHYPSTPYELLDKER